MKRLALLLSLLFVLLGAAHAGAHGVPLTAVIQQADVLTVQIVDPYGSPLEGLHLEAVTANGARRVLDETAPGQYTLPPTKDPVTIEFRAAGDIYRATAEAGAAVSIPMTHYPGGAGAWVEPALFGGGLLALLAVTGVALLRRPAGLALQEEDKPL